MVSCHVIKIAGGAGISPDELLSLGALVYGAFSNSVNRGSIAAAQI